MSSKGASRLNLKQALEIQANQYRNVNNTKDYQPEEVDARIYELQSNKDARNTHTALKRENARPTSVLKLMNAIAIEAALGADEGQAAAWDYEESEELIVMGKNGFSYQVYLVPARIMEF